MKNQADKTLAQAGPATAALASIPGLVMAWWEEHQYDTTGEHGEFNVFDEEPEFVTAARQVLGAVLLAEAAPETAAERDRLKEINAELLEALIEEHRACDWLMARLIEIDPSFLPSKSLVWPKIVAGNLAISKATGGAA